jgi:Ca-activated chloride channel family protein
LLDGPQQSKALQYGFRPADVTIPLGAPIDRSHGVDPAEPKTTLEVPSSDVIQAIIDLWRERKKHSQIVVALDVSGSMAEEDKLASALVGAEQLVEMLGDEDSLSLLVFNDQLQWAFKDARLEEERDQVATVLASLFASGGTALFDAIGDAHEYLSGARRPDRISAVVVLSDGDDRDSAMELDELLARISATGEDVPIRVFTIGYGEAANEAVLAGIADDTQARYFEGTTENIREVFKDIATFF